MSSIAGWDRVRSTRGSLRNKTCERKRGRNRTQKADAVRLRCSPHRRLCKLNKKLRSQDFLLEESCVGWKWAGPFLPVTSWELNVKTDFIENNFLEIKFIYHKIYLLKYVIRWFLVYSQRNVQLSPLSNLRTFGVKLDSSFYLIPLIYIHQEIWSVLSRIWPLFIAKVWSICLLGVFQWEKLIFLFLFLPSPIPNSILNIASRVIL